MLHTSSAYTRMRWRAASGTLRLTVPAPDYTLGALLLSRCLDRVELVSEAVNVLTIIRRPTILTRTLLLEIVVVSSECIGWCRKK